MRTGLAALTMFVSIGLVGSACGPHARAPGDRTPLSASCERLDGTRCLLPWPSSTYAVVDRSTATGLRLSIDFHSLPTIDDPAQLNQIDGYSVATPLAVGFPVAIDPSLDGQKASTAFQLFVATPGPSWGQSVPIRLSLVSDSSGTDSMLLGYGMRALAYDTDYVAVVLDQVKGADGSALTVLAAVQIALGLAPPRTADDQALANYHAPTRQLLKDVGIDRAQVLRVFDFTTRSEAGLRQGVEGVRSRELAALDAGEISVSVTSATPLFDGGALEVLGQLSGVPGFLSDAGMLVVDGGAYVEQSTHLVPFRALLPTGAGPYPMVVYGHGTGGQYTDTSFDPDLVGAGAGKLTVPYYGWTSDTAILTLLGFRKPLTGTQTAVAGLVQTLGDQSTIEAALSGPLGELLAAPTLGGNPNPAAGRTANPAQLSYAGGSLGGTMGLVHASLEPSLKGAVLNVPGAAWTHFAATSVMFLEIDPVLAATTPSRLDRQLGIAITQTLWDPADGAAWTALSGVKPCVTLVQESIGDPVVPNLGSDFVAQAVGATQVGVVLSPIAGLPQASRAQGTPGFTQFRVPSSVTEPLQIHGFAAGSSPAGVAAREQIIGFVRSVWAGAPDIEVPPTCQANDGGSCDFSGQ